MTHHFCRFYFFHSSNYESKYSTTTMVSAKRSRTKDQCKSSAAVALTSEEYENLCHKIKSFNVIKMPYLFDCLEKQAILPRFEGSPHIITVPIAEVGRMCDRIFIKILNRFFIF